jgi:hypothetical protein
MTENELIEKLKRVESLFARAGTEGEREAAGNALDRIRKRLEKIQALDPAAEYQFSMKDMWSRKLFVALLRRYGIRPYRYHRQRYTTVMARVPKTFVENTLWPEFEELNEQLREYLRASTDRVIQEAIHEDSSEAEVRNELPARG